MKQPASPAAGSKSPGSGTAEKEKGRDSEPGRRAQATGGPGDQAAEQPGTESGREPGTESGTESGRSLGEAAENELVLVLTTFPKPEDIGEIAYALVGANLCACVNVLSESLSIYRWRGEIVTNKEVLCLIKTTRDRHPELVARLSELHPYEVPEIVTLPTWAVNASYLRWVQEETDPHRSSTGPIRLADLQERDGESAEESDS